MDPVSNSNLSNITTIPQEDANRERVDAVTNVALTAICTICREIPTAQDAMLTNCNHTFCRPCLTPWVESRRNQNIRVCPCPLCREPIDDLFPNIPLREPVENYIPEELTARDLGTILRTFSAYGNENGVNALITGGRFAEISGIFLGESLVNASLNHHTTIVSALVTNERFSEINVADIEESIRGASRSGFTGVVNVFMNSNRFADISVETLSQCFAMACENGHATTVQAFLNCNRFAEIADLYLESGFELACAQGMVSVINVLLANDRYKEIHLAGFGSALEHPSQRVREALVQSKYFNHLSLLVLLDIYQSVKNKDVADALKIQIKKRIKPIGIMTLGIAAISFALYSLFQSDEASEL